MDELRTLIEELTQELNGIQVLGRELQADERARARAIERALPHLHQAEAILTGRIVTPPSDLITYKITSDVDGKLKENGRIACNFWNRFVVPASSIVIRLGVFSAQSSTIARAYHPYTREGVVYGRVEFNTKYLAVFSGHEIAGTIIHELGHTLGFGWENWLELFDHSKGKFKTNAVGRLPDLEEMEVETDYGSGTRLSHWDEETFDKELMTGFKDEAEHVLPVTIKVMRLLGHQVAEELLEQTDLSALIDEVSQVAFTRQVEAKALDLDYFEETDLWEVIPHGELSE